jgi:hypothetical protein
VRTDPEGSPDDAMAADVARAPCRSPRSRLVDNTLLWERGPLTLRLESALGKDEPIRVAQSLEDQILIDRWA